MVVWITGAGQGIGEACALGFARAGMTVALSGRTVSRLEAVREKILELGGAAGVFPCDVTSREAVEKAAADIQATLGPIEVLVANAGVAASAPFLKTSDALIHSTFSTNFNGPLYCMQAVLPGMLERARGRVINIASTAGKVGYQYTSVYCASKHAVVGLTRAVALEVARKGVTVNAICPGFVDTPMTEHTVSNIARTSRYDEGGARAWLEGLNPQGRLVTPDEVAALALFLASPAAQGINGQAIPLDGGSVQS